MKIQNFETTLLPILSETYDVNVKGDICEKSALQAEIQAWLISYLAELLEIDPDEVEVTMSFFHFGLDSSAVIILSGDLENWLGFELDPILLYDYPTIEVLAKHLAEESKIKVSIHN